MKFFRYLIVAALILTPTLAEAQTKAANRAWKPFVASLKAAAQKKDRNALMKFMSRDFYYLSSGGDENGNNDSRDEAFEYWQNAHPGAWDAMDKVLAGGSVVNTARRNPESRWPSRIAPPAANEKTITHATVEWYAVFEFRNGRWYFTSFVECCE